MIAAREPGAVPPKSGLGQPGDLGVAVLQERCAVGRLDRRSGRSRPAPRSHGSQQGLRPFGAAQERPDRRRADRRLEAAQPRAARGRGPWPIDPRPSPAPPRPAPPEAAAARADPAGRLASRRGRSSSALRWHPACRLGRQLVLCRRPRTSEPAERPGRRPAPPRSDRSAAVLPIDAGRGPGRGSWVPTIRSQPRRPSVRHRVEDPADLVGPIPCADNFHQLPRELLDDRRFGRPIFVSTTNSRSAIAAHELSTAIRIHRFAASRRTIPASAVPARGSRVSPSASATRNRTRESGSSARSRTLSRKGPPTGPAGSRQAGPPGHGPPARGPILR